MASSHDFLFPHNLSDFNFIVIEKIMNTDGDLDNTLLKREGYKVLSSSTVYMQL